MKLNKETCDYFDAMQARPDGELIGVIRISFGVARLVVIDSPQTYRDVW